MLMGYNFGWKTYVISKLITKVCSWTLSLKQLFSLFESFVAAKTCEAEASKLTADERTTRTPGTLGNHGILIVLLWPSIALPRPTPCFRVHKSELGSKEVSGKSYKKHCFLKSNIILETWVVPQSLVGINLIYRRDGWSRN